MDPLSLTASIVAVITAANVGVKGLRKLDHFRRAPQEIEELTSELESIKSLLEEIASFARLNSQALHCESLFQCVGRAGKKTNDINTLLATAPSNFPRLNDAGQARLLLFRYKDRLKCLRDDLRVVRMDLAVRLSLVEASSSCRLESTLSIAICAQNRMSHQLSIVFEEFTASKRERQQTLEANCSTKNDVSSSEPLTRKSNNIQRDMVLTDTPKSRQCVAWCSCVCHTRRTLSSPWFLRTMIGEFRVQYSSQHWTCNEFNCLQRAKFSFYLTYQLPSYLMKRYIVMTMQYCPLDGPQFSLRVPRVMNWCHILWNHTRIGNLTAIQEMFSEGQASPFDVNQYGSNALVYAASHGDPGIVRFLIQQGADPDLPNESGRTATEMLWENSFAGGFGSEGVSIMDSLLNDSDYVQTRNFGMLHKTVLGIVYKELTSELELSTATIDSRDSSGRTPLCWASIRDDERAVRTLLEYGASPKTIDDHGHTPLHFVKSPGVCKLLLDAGVDIYARNAYYERSVLHQLARGFGNIDVLNMLVYAGIDVDGRDSDGETPLMSAIIYGLTPMALRLLEMGANVNLRNSSSKYSALHLATRMDQSEIVLSLLEKGADYTAKILCGRNLVSLAAQYAGAKTLSVLARAELGDLDVALRDHVGKTAADYLAERRAPAADKTDLHEQFDKLLTSTRQREKDVSAAADADAEVGRQAEHYYHLPGAYPMISHSAQA